MASKSVVELEFTLAIAAGAGQTAEFTLEGLGREGVIQSVVIREDAALNDATSVDVLITREGEAPDANADETQAAYVNRGVALTGSATIASLKDNVAVDGGAWYGNGQPIFGVVVLAAGGGGASTLLYCKVIAETYR